MRQKSRETESRRGERLHERTTHDVVFTLDQPQAQAVFVCGDFNEWSPRSLRMFRRGEHGPWEKRIALPPGRYEYKFIVDGAWVHDGRARENKPNPHGSLNSILEVQNGSASA